MIACVLQILGLFSGTQRAAQQAGAAQADPQEDEELPPPAPPGSSPPQRSTYSQFLNPPGPPAMPPPSPPNLNSLRVGGPGQPGQPAAGQQQTFGFWPMALRGVFERAALEQVRGNI